MAGNSHSRELTTNQPTNDGPTMSEPSSKFSLSIYRLGRGSAWLPLGTEMACKPIIVSHKPTHKSAHSPRLPLSWIHGPPVSFYVFPSATGLYYINLIHHYNIVHGPRPNHHLHIPFNTKSGISKVGVLHFYVLFS